MRVLAKSPGQIAYESDCEIEPNYLDGARRKEWDDLPPEAKASWERNPTVRRTQQWLR